MRILHIIPSISPRRGGPSQAVLAMVAAQRKLGLEAAILTTNDDGPTELQELPLQRWCEVNGVPVFLCRRWSPPVAALREFAIAPSLLPWLDAHLRDYDLLHVHALFSFPSTAAMALARRRRVPYILRTIGQLQRWSLARSAGRKQLMLRLIEWRNLEGAAALHFTSAAEQEEAADLGLTTRGFVLPLGVETPTATDPPIGASSSSATDMPVQWLFLSRLHPKKQLHHLLEALALVRQQNPAARWQLHIAGDGDPTYTAALRQQASHLGLEPCLQWHGFVAGESKEALLHQADWFVLPSAAENFGIAAAEALAHGVPVLLAPGVALAQLVVEADAGHCVDPSPTALAEALQQHALHPPSPARRQAARRLAAERFSWPAITQALREQYRTILFPPPL